MRSSPSIVSRMASSQSTSFARPSSRPERSDSDAGEQGREQRNLGESDAGGRDAGATLEHGDRRHRGVGEGERGVQHRKVAAGQLECAERQGHTAGQGHVCERFAGRAGRRVQSGQHEKHRHHQEPDPDRQLRALGIVR
jgi:hypothetical protein